MKQEYMAPEVGSLAHYGVKGMKWGKRKARAKADSTDIQAARGRVSKENRQYKSQKRAAQNIQDGEKRVKALKDVEALRATQLKNPDRAISARMTRGEKVATLAVGAVTGFGLLPAALVVGGVSARARGIERNQQRQRDTDSDD